MTNIILIILGFVSAVLVFILLALMLNFLEERQKKYCEYCGLHKKNVMLWIKDGYIHKICEDCLKEGVLNDKK